MKRIVQCTIILQDTLQSSGYHQYEISSFAKPNHESRHNKKYWTQQDYLGLGLGASSNIGNRRFDNVQSFLTYFKMIDVGMPPVDKDTIQVLSQEEWEKEYIMLTMRLIEGLSIAEVNQRFGIYFLTKYEAAIQKNLNNGIVCLQEGRLRFTRLGLDVGNQFYLDIL